MARFKTPVRGPVEETIDVGRWKRESDTACRLDHYSSRALDGVTLVEPGREQVVVTLEQTGLRRRELTT